MTTPRLIFQFFPIINFEYFLALVQSCHKTLTGETGQSFRRWQHLTEHEKLQQQPEQKKIKIKATQENLKAAISELHKSENHIMV